MPPPEPAPPQSRIGPSLLWAIGAIAAATIFCEIALTRLFSVVRYYHAAFLAISLALFGFAVSGVWVYLRIGATRRAELEAALLRWGLAFAVSVPLCFFFYLYVGADRVAPSLLGERGATFAGALLEYAVLALPFFCSGVCISLLLRQGAAEANRLYAADLSASAGGAVLVVPALAWLGGPKSLFVATLLAAAAVAPFARRARGGRFAVSAVMVAAVVVLAGVPMEWLNQPRLRKDTTLVAHEPIRWNAFSMVGVAEERPLPFADPDEQGRMRRHRGRQIVIDNNVVTEMVSIHTPPDRTAFLRKDFTAPAHLLRPNGSVLIIGSGGGRDIQVARAYHQRHIRAVEVNPLVVHMAEEEFGDFTGHVYSAPEVERVVGDARSYIANSHERFDVILASLIDTWATSAAGAFALTENLLYTADAFQDYYEHLSDDGVLSIARWHPLDTPRLLATAFDAWRRAGVEDPRRHAAVLLTPQTHTMGSRIVVLLMKRSPFEPEEIEKLEAFATDGLLALTPTEVHDPIVAAALEVAEGRGEGPWPGLDVGPVDDDRPFFFNMVKPSVQLARMLGLRRDAEVRLAGFAVNLDATALLLQLLGAVLVLILLTIGIPLALRRDELRGGGWGSVLTYFACLGLGYILIEIGLLQRLILLLGKPIYALAVILATMLLASGLGSWASGRLPVERSAVRLSALLGGTVVLLLAYAFWLPDAIRALLGAPTAVRFGAAVAFVAVPAFVLGMPFPTGLRLLGARARGGAVPWIWGINGATSVLASVLSIILAIELGYTAVFLLGSACYVAAALLVRRWGAPA